LLSGNKGLLSGNKSLLSGDEGLLSGDEGLLSGDEGLLSGDKGLLSDDNGSFVIGKCSSVKMLTARLGVFWGFPVVRTIILALRSGKLAAHPEAIFVLI
jgi:hypothetical protein